MKIISLFVLIFLLGCATQTSSSSRGIASLPGEGSQPAKRECMPEKAWQEYYRNQQLKYAPRVHITIKEPIKIPARKSVSEILMFTNYKCHFKSVQEGVFSDSESLNLVSERQLNLSNGPNFSNTVTELGASGYYFAFQTDDINGKKSVFYCLMPKNDFPTVSQFFTSLTKYFDICVPEPKKVELESEDGDTSSI